jgi:hypothetical protein
LGRYWRSSPLVFSCRRAATASGLQRSTPGCRCRGEASVVDHLDALVPGHRAAKLGRQPIELGGQRSDDLVVAGAVWQVQQHYEAGGSLHQGADVGLVGLPHDQVAFPVARHEAVGDPRGTLGDHDLVAGIRWGGEQHAPLGTPTNPPRAQACCQLRAERAAGPGRTARCRSSRGRPASADRRGTRGPTGPRSAAVTSAVPALFDMGPQLGVHRELGGLGRRIRPSARRSACTARSREGRYCGPPHG